LLTLSEVKTVEGKEGDFEVTVLQSPRYVDITKCIACGLCAEKCPRKVDDEYNEALNKRRAIYVQYPQAVPLKYAIDAQYCIYFQKGKCKACEKVCPSGAINFGEREKELTLNAGSLILAPGFETFDPALHDTYGYKGSPNIVTSLEFERILAASGPYGGELIRPSDQKEPEKIAWLQCVGSRDVHAGAKPYCSAVCCTHAIKQAMVAKDHIKGSLDAAIFYIDVRTSGKDFERYYNRAKDREGVRFIKSKITGIIERNRSGNLLMRYMDEEGRRAEEEFDMVVLSAGFSVPQALGDLAKRIGIDLDRHNFPETKSFFPVQTSRPGIFISGAYHSPKDIPSSVTDGSAAAAKAGALLSATRFSLSKKKELPPEIPDVQIRGERPRIGVFVCKCGTNIAGVVDVAGVARYAKGLPFVEYVDENLFSCSQDSQETITKAIEEHKLNRVVVASCSPQTHEPLFQETVRNAGINKYLFEMANIRNQCSWVHADNPEAATEKAKDLVRMAAEKVALLEPLQETELAITQAALVIGGGIAGMAAAQNLAAQGYKTYLIEKAESLGGNALNLYQTWKGEDIQGHTRRLIREIGADERIETFLTSEIKEVEGFVGNFTTTISIDGEEEKKLSHGVTIIATGAEELKPDEYLYGKDPRVVTSLELDRLFTEKDPRLREARTGVFIQCVGSRISERPYCSRVCCTHSVASALHLKEMNPEMDVFVLYRDIRTYGMREDLYREARERGIIFIRFDNEKGLKVDKINGQLSVRFTDCTLRREIKIRPDLLTLASAIIRPEEDPLSQLFKIPVNEDGFFVEAHVKLRPVDFATDGVFFCGLAHSPKSIDESIAQAQAAASRAVTLLAQKAIRSGGMVAVVNPLYCSSCGVCVAVCPYKAPGFNEETGKAEINPVLCKGCGLCVASCRSGAIHLNGFDEGQIMAMISQVSA
jgi:heterodisulfide reductase subunit A